MNVLLLISLVLATASAQQAFQCPRDEDGFFPDPEQCDLYYECEDGEIVEEKLCEDGLLFDDSSRRHEICDLPYNVECGDRIYIQEPTNPSPQCPRMNGFFPHDKGKCDVFYSCVNGVANAFPCAPGTYFSEELGICIQPSSLEEYDEICKQEEDVEDGEFHCPRTPVFDKNGNKIPHPTYADETDCQYFFTCLNGLVKMRLGCPKGEVFNLDTNVCDIPENVPDCADWYDLEETADHRDDDDRRTRTRRRRRRR